MTMRKTVKDMYDYTKQNSFKLLSNYPSEFWADYRINYDKYDRVFNRLFFGFKYFIQTGAESVADVTLDFIDDVYGHLLLNDKKYSELYRINVIDDEEYSLTDNYNVTEKMDRDTSLTGNTDTGSQNNTTTNKVAPFDSDSFSNNGENDEHLGQRHDTFDNVGTEDYILTRKGNIGVQTASDMIEKHKNLWTKWEFYEYIFREIAKELLIVE